MVWVAVKVAPSIATSFFTYELVRLSFLPTLLSFLVNGSFSISGKGVPAPAMSEKQMVV
jgi:hypothetical protein